jgi:hypothetical protein
MNINGQVGPVATTASLASGQNPILRLGNMGDTIVSELQGRYYENTYRGNTFVAGSGAITLPTTLASTAATFSLSNNSGSGKNLVLKQVTFAFAAAPAAASVAALVGGYSATNVTHTTPATPVLALLNGTNNAVGKVDTSATLPAAPTVLAILSAVEAASSITPSPVIYDCGGAIIIPPGGFVSIQATSAATGAATFVWDEVPI